MIRNVLALLLLARLAQAQVEPERVRAWVLSMPADQPLQVTLKSGEILNGTLAEAQDERFGIRVTEHPTAENPDRRTIKRWIEYQEVVGMRGEGIHVATSESELAPLVRIGDKTRIRTFTGDLVKGRIEEYDGSTLRIDDHTLSLAEGDIVRIDIRGRDSLLNGTLIGLGVGAGLAALAWARCDDPDCGEVAPAASIFLVAVGTGLGALADAVHRPYRTIYTGVFLKEKLTIAPILTPGTKGVIASFRF